MAVNFDALRKMDTEQLRELNIGVVQVINERIAARRVSEMRKFNVGDRARFVNSRTGRLIEVVIQKFNTKTCGCVEVDATGKPNPMRTWRVAPSLLQHA